MYTIELTQRRGNWMSRETIGNFETTEKAREFVRGKAVELFEANKNGNAQYIKDYFHLYDTKKTNDLVCVVEVMKTEFDTTDTEEYTALFYMDYEPEKTEEPGEETKEPGNPGEEQ